MVQTAKALREAWLREREVSLTFAGELSALDAFLERQFTDEPYPALVITGVQRAIYLLRELKAKRQ